MSDTIALINSGLCLALAFAAGWAVLHPHVDDGVIVKVGLMSACLGLLGCSALLADGLWRHAHDLLNQSLLLLLAGMAVIVGGLMLRAVRGVAR